MTKMPAPIMPMIFFMVRPPCSARLGGGVLDRSADADISPAAAEIARHGRVNVRIVRVRVAVKQRRGRHDLASLAIAALGHCIFHPGLLDLSAVGRTTNSFNGDDGAGADIANGQLTRTHRLAPHMHGADAAWGDAAAIFGADQIEMVAQHPQKRRVLRRIDLARLSVDCESEHISISLPDSEIGSSTNSRSECNIADRSSEGGSRLYTFTAPPQ